MNELRSSNEDLVLEYLEKFHSDRDFQGTETALRAIFRQFAKNDRFDEILPKVVTLNTLYSAGLRFVELHPVDVRSGKLAHFLVNNSPPR
jgi:hypothetical protein